MPYVKGWNIAGDVVQFIRSGAAYFPVSFDGVFAEALFRIGDIQAGSGTVVFQSLAISIFKLAPTLTPFLIIILKAI
jgi:hypothetical protein